MKKVALTLLSLFVIYCGSAQSTDPNKKYPPAQLKADVNFIKTQLFDAHANPFTLLTRPQYEKVFNTLDTNLRDSMTATSFYKYIKPCLAYLNDEHSGITIGAPLMTDDFKNGNVFLPFSLIEKSHHHYFVDELFIQSADLHKGDEVLRVEGEPTVIALTRAVTNTTGLVDQQNTTALQQFGYLYTLCVPQTRYSYTVTIAKNKTIIIKGTNLKAWQDYAAAKNGWTGAEAPIAYTRFGNAGYINLPAFNARNDKEMAALKTQFDGIFKQIKDDGVTSLFINVSKNGGGNSAVGTLLINYFYNKPYRDYQCNWRRSDEYLTKMQSWGLKDQFYESQPLGKLIHFDANITKPDSINHPRFNGKVYVMIGDGTFSSAIMFATIIKDNHIATLIGNTPANGHPNHFGELYNTKLPHTQLDIRFGVKEWIRPSGKTDDNVLRPDVLVDVKQSPEEVIKAVLR